jgi:DNA repair protein RadC
MNTTKTAEELPYERFRRYGADSLTDTELVAIILRTGTKNVPAVELARKILTENGKHDPDYSVLYRCRYDDLVGIPGIGEVKAVKLLCIAELSKRLSRVRVKNRPVFDSPETVFEYYGEMLRHEAQEKLLLIMLDTRLHLIGDCILSIGTVNCTLVDTREIMKTALVGNAVSILLAHNHPSGDVTPSSDDVKMTLKVLAAAEFLGIQLVDHIIIGDGFCSMESLGVFEKRQQSNGGTS